MDKIKIKKKVFSHTNAFTENIIMCILSIESIAPSNLKCTLFNHYAFQQLKITFGHLSHLKHSLLNKREQTVAFYQWRAINFLLTPKEVGNLRETIINLDILLLGEKCTLPVLSLVAKCYLQKWHQQYVLRMGGLSL